MSGWADLLEGLQLLGKHGIEPCPLHCEHDELWVMSDASKFTSEEIAKLDELGFFVSEDGFKSYRFGSA